MEQKLTTGTTWSHVTQMATDLFKVCVRIFYTSFFFTFMFHNKFAAY